MPSFMWIGLGAFLGANVRYLLQQWAADRWGTGFPYGTLVANVGGSFAIAFLLSLASERLPIPPSMRLFLVVGFLGGFTTFSSLSYDTLALLQQENWRLAACNLVGNVTLGLGGVVMGVLLARLLGGLR